ncbi:MAG: aspartyl protease family protein, partial [Candidatus Entotheonellia bacterium]
GPDLYLACPVCATFNPSDCHVCPHCGHTLTGRYTAEKPSARSPLHTWPSRWLIVTLVLAMGLQLGIVAYIWEHWRPSSLSPTHPPPQTLSEETTAGRDKIEWPRTAPMQPPATSSPGEGITSPAAQAENTSARGTGPATQAPVRVMLFDREGDLLRQVNGTLGDHGRAVITTFENIHGAYRGTLRTADRKVLPVTGVAQADPTTNRAVLALEPLPSEVGTLPMSLDELARTTYEETPAEQRYLAEKRAKAGRWEEAIAHWKRVLEMDSSGHRDVEAALEDAFLKSSAAAVTEGRGLEAHTSLLDGIAWLPERGALRVRLAESHLARGEYREAIEQYWLASELISSQAPDLMLAIIRIYHAWGDELLRQGQFIAAANTFREALQVDSKNAELYLAWGKAELRQRALHVAIQAFEAALAYDPGLYREVEPYLTKARALLGGPQTAVIDFPPGSTRIEVAVVLNGRVEVPLIIDTGASMTFIPTWAVELLGYGTQAMGRWVEVQTVGGPRRLPMTTVSRLEIQGLRVVDLPVVFGELPGPHFSKGLLGMDVLRQFSVFVDHEVGRMILRVR